MEIKEEKKMGKEEEEEKEEEPQQQEPCMICLDRAPDTTVTPCLHMVVCAQCSPQLQETPDAKICCQCRRPIQGVFYPNNELVNI